MLSYSQLTNAWLNISCLMFCNLCPTHPKMIKMHQFCREGFALFLCPSCNIVENYSTRDANELQSNINTLHSIFSQRMRKKIVHTLTKNNGFKDENERLQFIANTNNQMKGISDAFCCKELSKIFGIPITKVVESFFKIKREKQEFSITDYTVDSRIQ